MTLAMVCGLLLAAFDVGGHFAEAEAWKESAVDFTVDRAKDGFAFASQKRDIVNCLKRDACTWHGIAVWESKVYYGAEGAVRVEMSLFNTGDAKEGESMTDGELRKLLASVEAKLGEGAKRGKEEVRELKSGGHRHSVTWAKVDPRPTLTWGTGAGKGAARKVDWVRLTLEPKSAEKPKSAVKKSVSGNAAKAKVKDNVTKNAEGDVWIRNVPMVDQGQKGYCSVAVAERVLRYYGFAVDEHEFAQMAGSTAKGGTRLSDMKEVAKQVGSRNRLGFENVVSLSGGIGELERDVENYNKAAKAMKQPSVSIAEHTHGNVIDVGDIRAAMQAKVLKRARTKDARYKKFLTGVKTQVDRGIPIIWSVTLGYYPEPGLPQAMGGHTRLIVGYNAKTHEILYTDTWGAGHELKRMPEDWAFTMTNDAFLLRPL